MKIKKVQLLAPIAIFLVAGNLSAGPLMEKYRAEQAAAIAGALTAQQLIRPFNSVAPFVDHYYRQYANEGFVRTPASPAQMNLLKARLAWEYGPLSSKAFGHVEKLNDIVFAISRENPSLLRNPAGLVDEITEKVGNLANREKTFQGLQAEASEARYRGWRLTKRHDSPTFDLYDPQTGSSYQMKILKTASGSLRSLNEDYVDFATKHPEKARFFKGIMPQDQINELVTKGKLIKSTTPVKIGTQIGIQNQTTYLDAGTGIKVIAAKSELTAGQFRSNVRMGYALEERLNLRPAGLGNAMVGGFVAGAGISLAAQILRGEEVNWATVGESGGIGLASSAVTVILAQQIEQRFGRQLAQSVITKQLLPGLAPGTLSGALASTGVGAIVVLGFVAKDYFTDQITVNEALIQSGIGLGAVGVGTGSCVILTWATTGTILGSEVPVVGNLAGFVAGLIGGTAFYLAGSWYYENFKLEGIRAELIAFKQAATEWETQKMDMEIRRLRESASALRGQAKRALR